MAGAWGPLAPLRDHWVPLPINTKPGENPPSPGPFIKSGQKGRNAAGWLEKCQSREIQPKGGQGGMRHTTNGTAAAVGWF